MGQGVEDQTSGAEQVQARYHVSMIGSVRNVPDSEIDPDMYTLACPLSKTKGRARSAVSRSARPSCSTSLNQKKFAVPRVVRTSFAAPAAATCATRDDESRPEG